VAKLCLTEITLAASQPNVLGLIQE